MERKRKILLGTLIPTGFLLVVVVGGLIFLSQSYKPMQEAIDALESSSEITITENNQWISFDPANKSTGIGFIFYPGGNVKSKCYSIIARGVALNGSLVIIVKMPFDLAFFAPERGRKVIDAFPEISSWVIGGHSLGGAMAAKFVYTEPELFVGLILLAAYPAQSNDLSDTDISALSIYGQLDSVVSVDMLDTLSLLPSMSTTMIEIGGGNHANFGSYGEQKGDTPAAIPRSLQQSITIEQICLFIETI